ncbi:sensor histidine kinase [Kineococcus sp. R8]|nr:sensor histidine kinase [Kineococcus siccus]
MAAVRRSTRSALAQLAGGLGTGVLALVLLLRLLLVTALSAVGIGLLLAPAALGGLRDLADRERARLGRWGAALPPAGPVPTPLRAALATPVLRRELAWVAGHATGGVLAGAVGVLLPVYAVRDATFPVWWRWVPADLDASPWWWTVRTGSDTAGVALLGLAWAVLTVAATPALARAQGAWGRRLLAPPPGTDLSLRVAELTASRAAALDAHVVELRRIERSLHDGAQNRLVGVTVLLGAARRSLARDATHPDGTGANGTDPNGTDDLLERAQAAAEQALAELRSVVRTILPPVLLDRGLAGAVTGLAAACPVPCGVEVDVAGRLPASLEATAYFVVAEGLTNVARHSGARSAQLTVRRRGDELVVRLTDDGRGGADPARGSGLAGVLHRVRAHDGTLRVTSPPGGPTELEVRLPCGS